MFPRKNDTRTPGKMNLSAANYGNQKPKLISYIETGFGK
jgi:hypothetical protein